MNPRRLYRSRHDRQLTGVAGGMAEYLEIDPTVVRILWILSAFFGGFTIVLYIILAFVMPLEPVTDRSIGPDPSAETVGFVQGPAAEAASRTDVRREGRGGLYLGILLIAFGAIALVGMLLPGWAGSGQLGAAFVVALGVALLVGSTRRTTAKP